MENLHIAPVRPHAIEVAQHHLWTNDLWTNDTVDWQWLMGRGMHKHTHIHHTCVHHN